MINFSSRKKKTVESKLRQPRLMQGQDEISFRRSRTITGSKASTVRAANESKAELKSDRLKKQELKRKQKVILSVLIAIVCVAGLIYYLLSEYTATIRTISFSSPAQVSNQDIEKYKQSVSSYLGQRPVEHFRFVTDEKQLSEFVASRHPEVRSVSVSGGGLGYGDFTLSLRQPLVRWEINQKQYFVDENGEAFEKNYLAEPPVSVIDKSGASIERGDIMASKSFLRFLGRLVALIGDSELGSVTEVVLPPATTREIDIRLSGRPYLIKTHTDRDPAQEVEDLQRVIKHLEQKGITPEYIDIRVQGRAFYR